MPIKRTSRFEDFLIILSYGLSERTWLYYILNILWGFPLTLLGYIVLLFSLPFGRVMKLNGTLCFVFKKEKPWGMSIGMVIFIGSNSVYDIQMLEHEYGHTMQNAIFGPLTLFLVSIPSAVRFWFRSYRTSIGKPPKTDYDAVWFEGSATKIGHLTSKFYKE